MKRFVCLALGVALAATMVGCASSAAPVAAEKLITVSGEGSVMAAPDQVQITIGVTANGSTAAIARQNGNTAINNTVDAIKALGIAEEDITTSSLNLRNTYDNNGNENGYRMGVSLTITARDFDLASKAIDVAIDSGSNNLNDVSYIVSTEKELYNQALEAAVKDARAKAELLAAAEGKTIKEVQSIAESTNHFSVYSNPDTGGMRAAADEMGGTALMAGTTTVTANVTAAFIIQ